MGYIIMQRDILLSDILRIMTQFFTTSAQRLISDVIYCQYGDLSKINMVISRGNPELCTLK